MDNDDRQVGRILTRREVLALFGLTGVALLASCSPAQSPTAQPTQAATQMPSSTAPGTSTLVPTSVPTLTPADAATAAPAGTATQASAAATIVAVPNCVVSPALTEGPYFADVKLNRADIRSDPSDGVVKEGAPLQLTLRVSQMGSAGCTPLAGAMVDIWHCDALGVYSDFQAEGTAGKMFLRGYQVTDANGVAQFTTIYPGWYRGRAVHIHFKVRSSADAGKSYEFTSQFFFDETMTDKVHTQQPYATKGLDRLKNENDNIYQSGGSQLILPVTEDGQGYAATFDIGLQMA